MHTELFITAIQNNKCAYIIIRPQIVRTYSNHIEIIRNTRDTTLSSIPYKLRVQQLKQHTGYRRQSIVGVWEVWCLKVFWKLAVGGQGRGMFTIKEEK